MTEEKKWRPKKYSDERLSELSISLKKWVKEKYRKDEMGYLVEWCFDNDFNTRYFKRYCEQHGEFNDAYEFAKDWQEYRIAKGGMDKSFDSRFAQFYLSSKFGWNPKGENETVADAIKSEFGRFLIHQETIRNKNIED